MDFDDNSTQKVFEFSDEQPTAVDPQTQQALHRQQLKLLASDIENLRSLHALFKESPNAAQLVTLFKRVHKYLEQANQLITVMVLEPEQLAQFQEDKKYLDTLAFELTGEFGGKHGGHDHHHRGFGRFGHGFGHWGRGPWGHGHGHGDHGGHHDKWEKKCAKLQHKMMKKGVGHSDIFM